MRLTVGELAKRSGLTVRTLHHYDAIGLLKFSARSEARYRLYSLDDVARLYPIHVLRRFGMPLADIGSCLDRPDHSLVTLVQRQIGAGTGRHDRLETNVLQITSTAPVPCAFGKTKQPDWCRCRKAACLSAAARDISPLYAKG
ncbi:MerR family DNA-binding transcriptional regulator [Mycetohabitans sp. B8]|nr:MerR family DNA-binding transcriptional regulator [Mycetohabitans sp. B8]